jgi:hypothetical protein
VILELKWGRFAEDGLLWWGCGIGPHQAHIGTSRIVTAEGTTLCTRRARPFPASRPALQLNFQSDLVWPIRRSRVGWESGRGFAGSERDKTELEIPDKPHIPGPSFLPL